MAERHSEVERLGAGARCSRSALGKAVVPGNPSPFSPLDVRRPSPRVPRCGVMSRHPYRHLYETNRACHAAHSESGVSGWRAWFGFPRIRYAVPTTRFRPDPRSEPVERLFYAALKHPYKHPYEAVNCRTVVDTRPRFSLESARTGVLNRFRQAPCICRRGRRTRSWTG